MSRTALLGLLVFASINYPLPAQPNLAGAPEIRLALERANVLGSVLMIGAHPDDENTAALVYLTRGRHVRTAYLSLTRGEGGQNLLGPEQGEMLGVIRTQELLAARRIDGAEQYFTRAIDFGFSKSADETFAKWGHDRILADVVWVIRRYRPDVIISCFSGTPRDGHGHHQAAGILAQEAFKAAADRARFPEQLKFTGPWQAKRLVWSMYRGEATPGAVAIDAGEYSPVLGRSYAEIAGMSRSMHRSQGMGSPERRGTSVAYLVPLAGTPAREDLFDGIDITWNRVAGGAAIGRILRDAEAKFDDAHPEATLPALLEADARLAGAGDPWARLKRRELAETIALCAGLWLDASADRWDAAPGTSIGIRVTALARSRVDARLNGIVIEGAGQAMTVNEPLAYNRPVTREMTWNVPLAAHPSQPYWLAAPRNGDTYAIADQQMVGAAENPPVLTARFRIAIAGREFEFTRPVACRYVDRLRGELTRPLIVVPRVSVRFAEPVIVMPDARPRRIEAFVKSAVANASGELELQPPAGWRVEPRTRRFEAAALGEEAPLSFEVMPPAAEGRGILRVAAKFGNGDMAVGMDVIAYSHIQPQAVFPPAEVELVEAGIKVLARRIGYVMGAGDEIPRALRQIGCDVTLLTPEDLASGDLSAFDAIVTGVRAYNVRSDLRANQHRLLDYVSNGGTLVVQYNVLDAALAPAMLKLGPYPIRIGRERVTNENAPVAFPDPASPLLNNPNRIGPADFAGWVQERGLYFADQWDARYKPLFESHDADEAALPGGTLYARYGRGAYVFTAYSWFRQLPAGVPGALRIFANLLGAAKVLP
jgi:LmbE family N-acetylglucosaminyl deacetylase